MIAVIFDLDGTLIDSAPEIHRVANEVLALEGLGAITLDEARSYVGHGLPNFVAQMLTAKGQDAGDDLHERTTREMLARYAESHELTTLYPGVRSALEQLHKAGHPLGVCTNKPYEPARAVIAHFGLTEMFGAVLGGDSLPERKPDPRPLFHTAELLGAEKMLFVGDSEIDAETGRAAGVPFALYTQGYRKVAVEDLPHAHAFDHYDALMDIVAAEAR